MSLNPAADMDAICLISSGRELIYVSTSLKSRMPWTHYGRNCYNYFFKRKTPCANCPFDRDMKDGEHLSTFRKLSDGSTARVCHTRSVISGKVYGIEYFAGPDEPDCSERDRLDIRRKAMDCLMRSMIRDEEITDSILINIPSIAIGSHPDGSVYYVSPSVLTTGWDPGELFGRYWWNKTFSTPDEGARMLKKLKASWKQPGYDIGVNTRPFRFKDGSLRLFEWRIHKTAAGNIKAIGFDVTDNVALREQLKERKRDLELLFYHISHDLRGPVASAMGLNNMLLNIEDDRMVPLVEMMKSSLDKLDYLIRDMHLIARVLVDPIDIQEVKMAAIFSNVRNKFREELENTGCQLFIHNKATRCYFSDGNMLELLLEQLISNSIVFRRSGRFLSAQGQRPWIKVYANHTGKGLHLYVRDNGKGIAEKIQDNVFDMFCVGERSEGGTGMGLFLVRNIIEKLGGTVKLRSKIKEGTTVDILIPGVSRCK